MRGSCHSLTHSHLSVPHSGAKCRSGCCHPACVFSALCPGAPGGREGVLAAVREEDLAALRMSSCHHVAHALSGAAMETHQLLLAYQSSDMGSSGHAALQT